MQVNSYHNTPKDGATTLNQRPKKVNEINGPKWLSKTAKNTPSFRNQKLNHFSTSWPFFAFKSVGYRWLRQKDGCGDGHHLAAGWLRGLPVGEPSPPTSAKRDQPISRRVQ